MIAVITHQLRWLFPNEETMSPPSLAKYSVLLFLSIHPPKASASALAFLPPGTLSPTENATFHILLWQKSAQLQYAQLSTPGMEVLTGLPTGRWVAS